MLKVSFKQHSHTSDLHMNPHKGKQHLLPHCDLLIKKSDLLIKKWKWGFPLRIVLSSQLKTALVGLWNSKSSNYNYSGEHLRYADMIRYHNNTWGLSRPVGSILSLYSFKTSSSPKYAGQLMISVSQIRREIVNWDQQSQENSTHSLTPKTVSVCLRDPEKNMIQQNIFWMQENGTERKKKVWVLQSYC